MSKNDNVSKLKKKLIDFKKSLVDSTLFKIHYVELYDKKTKKKNINATSDCYMYPDEISREDALKLISYIVKSTKDELKEKEISLKTVAVASRKLDSYGFVRIPYCYSPTDELYVVNGDREVFKKSKHNYMYFDWYTEDYTMEEIDSIKGKIHSHFIPYSKKLLR